MVTLLGLIILGVFGGFKYQLWLDETQPSEKRINLLNIGLGLDMCLFGGLSLVTSGALEIICSFIFGFSFGLILVNRNYIISQNQY